PAEVVFVFFYYSFHLIHLLFHHLLLNTQTHTHTHTHTHTLSSTYLEADLLVEPYGPVAEGDGVAEAGLALDGPLCQVHEDLRALGAGVVEQRAYGHRL